VAFNQKFEASGSLFLEDELRGERSDNSNRLHRQLLSISPPVFLARLTALPVPLPRCLGKLNCVRRPGNDVRHDTVRENGDNADRNREKQTPFE
jgi:hypothetical protein